MIDDVKMFLVMAGLTLVFGGIPLQAQDKVRLYQEQIPEGFAVYVDNDEYCPVSMDLTFKLTNLKRTDDTDRVYLIPPRSTRFKLTELHAVRPGKESSVAIEVTGNFGDHNQRQYDEDFVYHLPYHNGESYVIGQGYNGAFSHQNENCLDFDMPIGTKIYSARGGIVCKVVESNKRHCGERECMKYNNFIRIYHSDGTFAEYSHLKQDGALVNEGDIVEIGQHIGYSGNTGWASGPHLHFVVFLQRLVSRETLKTPFLIRANEKPEFLVEKQRYTRAYE